MRRNFRLNSAVKQEWQRVIQDMQQPMPVHYRSLFQENVDSMSISEFLVYLTVCDGIQRRWKRDIFTRLRITYFYIWTHLIFGWIALVIGLLYAFGMLTALIGIALALACVGGGISSIIAICTLVPEAMLMGVLGLAASVVAGLLVDLTFDMGHVSYNVADAIVDWQGLFKGIDIMIFQKEWYLALFSLLIAAIFWKITHWLHIYEVGLMTNLVMIVLGLVFFR